MLKKYPKYNMQGPEFRGLTVTVTLESETVCGPIIRASCTITARNDSRKELNGAATAAEFGAKHRLSVENHRVEDRCIGRGTHDHKR